MKRWISILLLALVCTPALASVLAGQPAPAFSLTDTTGRTVSLAQLAGRTVVLEWVNPQCPFVRKHYGSQNMQSLQKRYTTQDVVWLAIQSTHPGHPDHFAPAELAEQMKRAGAAPSAILMDDDGTVGRLYGARTTPHMYVIDPAGRLAYVGAIDDRRSADPQDVKTARNHVAAALDELKAGRPVTIASTPPYGCSVKYR